MGYDYGFDIFPPLDQTAAADRQVYREFVTEVIDTYGATYDEGGRRPDGKILVLPDDQDERDFADKCCIFFMVGECPSMPRNPDRYNFFLRFSSKISGGLISQARLYIRGVYNIARKHLGGGAHFWHEMDETGGERQWGIYDWDQIRAAHRELKDLEP